MGSETTDDRPGLNWTQEVDGVTEIRSGRHDDIARITFDYISRLPEQYYFRAVN